MNKIIKFLGIPIGKEYIKNEVYRKKILFHEIKFNLNETHITYRFLGIKYLTVSFLLKETIYNYFNIIKITKKDKNKVDLILHLLIDYVKDKLKTDKFDILYIYVHSGEVFLSMYHIKEFIEKNQIKNPVFVTTRLYNINIMKMFYPEIPAILIPKFCALYCQNRSELKYKDYTVRMYLPPSHFWEFEQKLKNGEKRYFYDEIKNTMNVSSEITALPVISEEDKEDAEVKTEMAGLKKPFIYVCTDALSSATYNISFWDKLHVELFKLNQKINGGGV